MTHIIRMSTQIATRSVLSTAVSQETKEVLQALNTNASTLNLGGKPLRYATFEDCVCAIGAEICGLAEETTDPVQAKYRSEILSGLRRTGFITFLEETMVPLTNLADAEFARFTLSCNVKRWLGDEDDRQKQDEKEDTTPFRPRREVRGIPLGKLYFSEKLRAMRFLGDEMRNRIWHTYDGNEMREITLTQKGKETRKMVPRCDPTRATYRMGDHVRQSESFTAFCEYLLEAYRFFEKFDENLTQFSELFRKASGSAFAMRKELEKKAFEEKKKDIKKVQPVQPKPAPKPRAEQERPVSLPATNVWDERKKAQAQVQAKAEPQPPAEPVQAEPQAESDAHSETDEGFTTRPLNKKGQRFAQQGAKGAKPTQRGRRPKRDAVAEVPAAPVAAPAPVARQDPNPFAVLAETS